MGWQGGLEGWIRNMNLSGMLGGWEDNSFHTALKFHVVASDENRGSFNNYWKISALSYQNSHSGKLLYIKMI